jgi:hypothetical protein
VLKQGFCFFHLPGSCRHAGNNRLCGRDISSFFFSGLEKLLALILQNLVVGLVKKMSTRATGSDTVLNDEIFNFLSCFSCLCIF